MLTRRSFLGKSLAAAIFAVIASFLPFLVGCSTASIADYVLLIGNNAALLASYFAQDALAAQIKSLASAIAVDVTNWQSGSSAALAIQSINALIGLIDKIPVVSASPYAGLIVLLLSALTGLLSLLPNNPTAVMNAHDIAVRHNVTPRTLPNASSAEVKKAIKEFRKNWQSIADGNAKLQSK